MNTFKNVSITNAMIGIVGIFGVLLMGASLIIYQQTYAGSLEARAEMMTSAALLAVAVVLGVLSFFIIKYKIIKPMNNLKKIKEFIVEIQQSGDLAMRLDLKSNDETGELATSINNLLSKFQKLVVGMNSSSERLATASEELSASATQVSAVAGEVKKLANKTVSAYIIKQATMVENVVPMSPEIRLALINRKQRSH